MEKINCNGWAPRNPLPYEWSAPIPIINPLIANSDSLYYNFIFTIFGGPARFYHRLAYMLYNILDEGGYFDVLYNILDEDGYLYEDN